ncbi:hypothetical protein CYMTET_50609 [Cymbomonas tetramitiformis]|uniref:Uncharacterized protein n=1 Tax=Cymbomonas tetramitiformis TaxID=36881 RepID=A0AAE0EUK8_9CHLO|nr:hypothetical protein CYMTET_50609 [Cymbomonas tetramitiformis]
MDTSYDRGSGTWRHCRGCIVQRDRAERLSVTVKEAYEREKAAELRSEILQSHVKRLEREVERTFMLGMLRIWAQYCTGRKPLEPMASALQSGHVARLLKLRTFWRWRAHTRQEAWSEELSGAAEALARQKQEVARLRETVFFIQQDLSGVETSRHRMSVLMYRIYKRHLRRRVIWAWVQAVWMKRALIKSNVAILAVRWRLHALQRVPPRMEEQWTMRTRKWQKLMIRQKHFDRWRRRAGLPVILQSYRQRIDALQSSMKLLHLEACSLRLFKDAVTSADFKLMRKGGGYMPMQDFIAKIQNKVASAMVKDALTSSSLNPDLERYGLGGVVSELAQSMSEGQFEEGFTESEQLTPRGGVVSMQRDNRGMRVSYSPSTSWLDAETPLADTVVPEDLRARAGGLGAKAVHSRKAVRQSMSAAIGEMAEPHRKVSLSFRAESPRQSVGASQGPKSPKTTTRSSSPVWKSSGRSPARASHEGPPHSPSYNSPTRSSIARVRQTQEDYALVGSDMWGAVRNSYEDPLAAVQYDAVHMSTRREWDALVEGALSPGSSTVAPSIGYGFMSVPGSEPAQSPVQVGAAAQEAPHPSMHHDRRDHLDLSPKQFRESLSPSRSRSPTPTRGSRNNDPFGSWERDPYGGHGREYPDVDASYRTSISQRPESPGGERSPQRSLSPIFPPEPHQDHAMRYSTTSSHAGDY